jgi:hypothetical protein
MDFRRIRAWPLRPARAREIARPVEYNEAGEEVYPPVWDRATSPPEPESLPWIR